MKKRKSLITICLIILISIIITALVIIKPKFNSIQKNIYNEKNNIKYVFLFIGDGMNENQVEHTEIYNNSINSDKPDKQEFLSFTNFPVIGLRKNYDYSSYIPDSASSGTAIASGLLTTKRNVEYER